MNDLINALEAIETANLGNARLQAIADADSPELREFFKWALSPDITFGIKKFPDVPEGLKTPHPGPNDWWYTKLVSVMESLSTRNLTGNEAKAHLISFFSVLNELELKWAKRVLSKDLRLNIGAKDVNKVLPGTIDLFNIALAEELSDIKDEYLAKHTYFVSTKMDGVRAIIYIPNKKGRDVRILSRTGKIYTSFESVRLELQRFSDLESQPVDWWLDGEIVCLVNGKINFQALQKNIHRRDGLEDGFNKFIGFDCVAGDWGSITNDVYRNRFQTLKKVFIPAIWTAIATASQKVAVVDSEVVQNPTKEMLVNMSARYVGAGFEGAIAREADHAGKQKRSKYLIKIKEFKDDEAIITGLVEGEGRLQGMLGAFNCKTMAGVDFQVGSGFNDAERKEYWDQTNIGRQFTYRYFGLTDTNTPRFPIWHGFRADE